MALLGDRISNLSECKCLQCLMSDAATLHVLNMKTYFSSLAESNEAAMQVPMRSSQIAAATIQADSALALKSAMKKLNFSDIKPAASVSYKQPLPDLSL